MKNSDNIEKLFKETFENFEANVDPKVWSNVQSGIQSFSGGASSVAAKVAVGKIIAGIASVVILAGGVWYFASSDNQPMPSSVTINQQKTETTTQDIPQNNNSENTPVVAMNDQEKTPSASTAHPSAKNSSDNVQQPQITSGSSDNTSATNNSSSANSEKSAAPSEQQSKYGRSSDGPTSLIRANQVSTAKEKSSNDNSTSEEQISERVPAANNLASTDAIEAPPILGMDSIPNVFTPNGDGNNDVFNLKVKNFTSIQVTILDMKGSIVYSWTAADGNWNGKLPNGAEAPKGLYFYTIQATGTDGLIHNKQGSVTLSR